MVFVNILFRCQPAEKDIIANYFQRRNPVGGLILGFFRKREYMRTREMSYEDYGMTCNEVNYVKEFCKKANKEQKEIINTALSELDPYIASKCLESIVKDKSYEDLCMEEYIYIGKGDFYGHRRKGIESIKRWMILYGIWEM